MGSFARATSRRDGHFVPLVRGTAHDPHLLDVKELGLYNLIQYDLTNPHMGGCTACPASGTSSTVSALGRQQKGAWTWRDMPCSQRDDRSAYGGPYRE